MRSLAEKIGQMLVVGFQGLQPPDYILEWLREGKIGGVILFARNVESPQQLADLTAQVHAAAKYPALIGIDQEGGTVARMRDHFTESPGAMALSASSDEVLTEEMTQVLGAEMAALGINWTYAPAVDITYNKDNPTVGVRSFGSDKEHVSQFAAAAVRGFQAGKVAACAKHFPGLGDTALDTHQKLPVLNTSLEQLKLNDILPYRALLGENLASIMTTHTIYSTLDPDHPATLSQPVIQDLIRGELKFNGVVVTDCMEMKAIADHYGAAESAVLAALAGIDVILFSHTRAMQEKAYAGLLQAAESGRIPLEIIDAANARIDRMKAQYPAQTAAVEVIKSEDHLHTAQRAARAGMVLHRADADVFPLRPEEQSIGLIEFASYRESDVVEQGGATGLADRLLQAVPKAQTVALRVGIEDESTQEKMDTLLEGCDVVVVATRNAHLLESELAQARDLLARAKNPVLLALRNPFDASVLDAPTVLLTLGDSAPSLDAAVDALLGEFKPTGSLPVAL